MNTTKAIASLKDLSGRGDKSLLEGTVFKVARLDFLGAIPLRFEH